MNILYTPYVSINLHSGDIVYRLSIKKVIWDIE